MIDLEQASSALAELAGENEALQARALTDKLTGLANRAALEEALTREDTRGSARARSKTSSTC